MTIQTKSVSKLGLFASSPIKLYDYQETAVEILHQSLLSNNRALLVAATGLGKTIMSMATIKRFPLKNKRLLFLCHDSGILDQAYNAFVMFFGKNYSFSKYYGNFKHAGIFQSNFVFATFQSKPNETFDQLHFDYVVVDESHHAHARVWNKVLSFFNPKWRLGLTATPDREDEKDIRNLFGNEVVNYSLVEALASGWLTPVDYRVMNDGLDSQMLEQIVQEVNSSEVKISLSQLNERVFVHARSQQQCHEILHFTSKGLNAIVFCRNLEHLNHVLSILPDSVVVHSEQSWAENDLSLRLFKLRKVRHILVVDKFNEGIDLPDTDMLVFLRSTDSWRIWTQQLGRGLRKFPGKEKVIVLDFVANVERIQKIDKLKQEVLRFSCNKRKDDLLPDSVIYVEGNHFSFNFTSEQLNLLQVVDRISQPYFSSWKEASEAAVKLDIKSQTDYSKKYKLNNRLHSSPQTYYQNFPGWDIFLSKKKYANWKEASNAAKKLSITSSAEYRLNCKLDPCLPLVPRTYYTDFPGWRVFLNIASPPLKWATLTMLSRDNSIIASKSTIKKFIEPFGSTNPEWFNRYYDNSGKCNQYYHPDLIELIRKSFGRKIRRTPPNGWLSANKIAKEKLHVKPKVIKEFAQNYKISNPSWFKDYWTESFFTEHYHPDLVNIIEEKFSNRQQCPTGWMSLGMIKNLLELKVKINTIRSFANQFRQNQPSWFKNYLVRSAFSECYHPDLVQLITLEFSNRQRIPPGWQTAKSIANDLGTTSTKQIVDIANEFSNQKPEWLKKFLVSTSITTCYHPELVDIIKRAFLVRKSPPDGWVHHNRIAVLHNLGGRKKVLNFANGFRDSHPEWFDFFWSNGKLIELFHPSLVKKILQHFKNKI